MCLTITQIALILLNIFITFLHIQYPHFRKQSFYFNYILVMIKYRMYSLIKLILD